MSFEAFLARARHGHLVPVWGECVLDTETPVAAFTKLKRGPFSFLLESAPAGSETWSRYTFMGTEPRGAWRMTDGRVEDWTPAAGWHNARTPADPLGDLEALLQANPPVEVPELGEFWSGAVGYFGYDVVRCIERLPRAPRRTLAAPDALFVFTNVLVVVDNLRSRARFVASVPVPDACTDAELRALYDRAESDIADAMRRLRAPGALPPLELDESATPAVGRSNYEKAKYLRDVQRIKEYIVAGDAFQVLLARRIVIPHDFSSALLYRALRVVNPVAVHVPSRTRRGGAGGQLARVAGARIRRPGDRAPDRRHAAARPHHRRGRCALRGAAGRREGTRRAPDAGGSGPQRRRAASRSTAACT